MAGAPKKNQNAAKDQSFDGTISGRCFKKEKGWWTLAMRKVANESDRKLNLMTWIRETLNTEAARILGKLP